MRLRWPYRIVLLLLGVALAVTAWAALTPLHADSHEQIYVIPKGTFARRIAGETDLQILPAELHLTLGLKDILVLRNDDDVPQLFGPVLIMPGQSFSLPFARASKYSFACQLHASGKLDVIVAPHPEPGWARLRWRVEALAQALGIAPVDRRVA